MKYWLLILAAVLLLAKAHAFFPDEFRPSSPGFHQRRLSKVRGTSGFKLPGTATPNSYNLTLAFNVSETDASLSGYVEINLDVLENNDPNSLTLNSEINFNETTDTFNWTFSNGEAQSCSLANSGPGFLTINCPTSIIGSNQTLAIRYTPTLSSDQMKGAYLVKYKEENKQKVLIATQFEEDSARRVFPCFDEPAYKASVYLTLESTGIVNVSHWVSNTNFTTNDNEGQTSTTFGETPKMSTYLLAFVATQDFQTKTAQLDDKNYTFEVFVRASAADNINTALTNGPLLIEEMGKFTGLSYEALGNSKMSLAGIPEFAAGAMENWGLITFRETYLIDEGDQTTNRDQQLIVEVIAHELAHQWFGDYVTMDWWSNTWLNEGFAEYFEYYLTDKLYSDYEMLYQLVIKEQQVGLKADAYPDSMPLSNNASDVTTDEDLSNEFGDISYSKGASIVKMLRYTLGDESFAKGLNNYLTKNANGNANADDLIAALQANASSDLNLQILFKEWIYLAGYPVLNVALDETNNATITATKFSSSLDKSGENDTANWWIPLTYSTAKNPNDTVQFQWIDPEKLGEVRIPVQNDSWVLFNLQAAGFYRVNYDQTLLERLIQVLNNSETVNTIHVLNRAQLLDDVFNIARSQEGSEQEQVNYYLNAFRLAEYLQFENEYHPWYTFFTEVQYLLGKIQDADTLSSLKEKILDIVAPHLNVTKLTDFEEHTQVLRSNLILSWACKLEANSCVTWALNEFKNYRSNSTSINNNFRDTILCTALSNANTSETAFDAVYQNLITSNLPLEQKDLALSLSCLSNLTHINTVLEATLNSTEPPFPRMFYETFLTGLSSDPSKIATALDFVLNNAEDISEAWNMIRSPQTILGMIANKVYTEDHNKVIEAYISNHTELSDDSAMIKAAKSAIDTISTNTKWVKKYGNVLKSVIVYDGGDLPETTTQQIETTTNSAGLATYHALLVLVLVPVLSLFYYAI